MKLNLLLLSILPILVCCLIASAQVQITVANAENIDTNWTNLDDIIIYESSANDIYNNNFMGGKLALLAPAGFEFNGEGNPTYSSKPMANYDIFDLFAGADAINATYGARVIIYEFEFNGGPARLGDTIILSGLQVRATSMPPPHFSGDIVRVATSNDENINGIITGVTTFGKLSTTMVAGISSLNNERDQIIIYPNPFKNSTTIQAINFSLRNGTLKVYDMVGKQIIHITNINGSQLLLDDTDLFTGIYVYELSDENGILKRGKMIIE